VSMMVDLKVMAYFKISLSTRNWDRAFFMAAASTCWWPMRCFIPFTAIKCHCLHWLISPNVTNVLATAATVTQGGAASG
ncbi:hypothetical protein, partial [Aeromonas allosaccharophila]|uniref:hypothetical protein n=1 Tax=Aeromonas allosaccharophila TaxID=656 RepID=UPI003D25228E